MRWWQTLVAFGVAALALAPTLVHADIYTWVDAAGSVNVSNVAPPEGVRVTRVTHDSPAKAAADTARAAAAHQTEVQALADRIAQLEREAAESGTRAAMHAAYSAPLPAPAYAAAPPTFAVQYSDPLETTTAGCAPSWIDCGSWWAQPAYPTAFFVASAPWFRRGNPGRPLHPGVPLRPPPGGRARPPQHPVNGLAILNRR